jgi:hypothetical protein
MRPHTRENLYWLLQQSVLSGRRGLAAEEYLTALNAAFGPIFRAFQDRSVVVDYTATGAVDAYRLHYVPHYAYMAYRGLVLLPEALYRRIGEAGLVYHAVAAGPFPEIVGVVEAAAARGVERGRIDVTVFDIAVDTWRDAAEQSARIARRLSPGIEIRMRFEQADLRYEPSWLLTPADLVTMQNCLNEFCHDGVPGPAVLALVNSVNRGGGLVVVDLSKYGPTRRAVSALEAELRGVGFTELARFDPEHTETTPFKQVPRDTFFHFYGFRRAADDISWERDYPPKKNLNFSWSVWSR